ncbi:hypothetical protein LEMLEM_LOCUS7745 [Lemmus lemmus]
MVPRLPFGMKSRLRRSIYFKASELKILTFKYLRWSPART